MVEFKRRDTLGSGGLSIEVLKDGLLAGHIRKGPNAAFRYYRGASNELTASDSDYDLEALKRRVSGTP